MNRSVYLWILLVQIFVSCSKNRETTDPLVVNDPVFADQLKSAPEKIAAAGNEWTLDAYLWRDFMPVTHDSGGSPLMCVIKFMGQSGCIPHNTISLSKIYVIYNDQTWINDTFIKNIISEDDWNIVVRDGPKWEINTVVDVIAEFDVQGQQYRLMSKSQRINATH